MASHLALHLVAAQTKHTWVHTASAAAVDSRQRQPGIASPTYSGQRVGPINGGVGARPIGS
jgi:hypothetical protein